MAEEKKTPNWPDLGAETLRILQLRSRNFMRLTAVDLILDPALNRLSSAGNGEGKSSILKLIRILQGLKHAPDEPIHQGARQSLNVIDLGAIVVKIDFKAKGSPTIAVLTREGMKVDSPVGFLQSIVNGETLDPREFAFKMTNEKRAEKLRAMIGLSTADLDAEYARIFGERTQTNSEAKRAKAKAEALPFHVGRFELKDDKPAVAAMRGVSDARDALHKKIEAINTDEAQVIRAAEQVLADRRAEVAKIDEIPTRIAESKAKGEARLLEIKAAIEALQLEAQGISSGLEADAAWMTGYPKQREAHMAEVTIAERGIETIRTAKAAERAAVEEELAKTTIDTAKAELDTITEGNRKHRENKARADAEAEATGHEEKAARQTERLDAIKAEKLERLSKAAAAIGEKVPGLAIDEDGIVTLGGVAFEQGSTGDRFTAAVMLVANMNPRLKVVLIEDASLLSDENYRKLWKLSLPEEEGGHGIQFITEEAGRGAGEEIEGVGGCVFTIEDGQVVGATSAEDATAAE